MNKLNFSKLYAYSGSQTFSIFENDFKEHNMEISCLYEKLQDGMINICEIDIKPNGKTDFTDLVFLCSIENTQKELIFIRKIKDGLYLYKINETGAEIVLFSIGNTVHAYNQDLISVEIHLDLESTSARLKICKLIKDSLTNHSPSLIQKKYLIT